MSKLKTLKIATCSFITGAIFFGGVSYAATGSVKIDALFGVKVIQGGVDKTPIDKQPFISNGTTYLPVRTVAELLEVPITWDGKNNAVIIGKKIDGVRLGAPNKVIVDNDGGSLVKASISSNQEMVVNGKSYGKVGFIVKSEQHPAWSDHATFLEFELNNKYKKLVLSLGIDDHSSDSSDKKLRNITFNDQDGKELQQFALGMGTVHEQVEIDVSGVLKLIVKIDGDGHANRVDVDFINPILVQ